MKRHNAVAERGKLDEVAEEITRLGGIVVGKRPYTRTITFLADEQVREAVSKLPAVQALAVDGTVSATS